MDSGKVLKEDELCDVTVTAKNIHGEGICNMNGKIIFIKNARIRIGNTYKVRITKVHDTFAYAELADTNSKYFIGNGSLIIKPQ